jgi:SAM-dependent methyltransferase
MPVIDFYGPDGWGADPPAPELDRQRVAREAIAALARRQPEGPFRVLDAGCGDGLFLERLAAHLDRPGAEYTGVDYSEHQLAKAARLPFEFHKCDLGGGIPLPDGAFDVVHAAEILEHLLDPDLLVDEAARVLRPGGHLVVTTPNLHAWFNRVLFVAGVQPVFHETSTRSTQVGAGPLGRFKADHRPVGHLRLYNRTAVVDLVRRSGFTPVRVRGARYHDVPRQLSFVDALLGRRATLAGILVVVARKDG